MKMAYPFWLLHARCVIDAHLQMIICRNIYVYAGLYAQAEAVEKEKSKILERLSKWQVKLLNDALDVFELPRGSGEEGQKVCVAWGCRHGEQACCEAGKRMHTCRVDVNISTACAISNCVMAGIMYIA